MIDHLLHPAIRWDERLTARHRRFIESNLWSGAIALLCGLIMMLVVRPDGVLERLALAWLAAPLLIACLPRFVVSLRLCQTLALINMAALVTFLAAITGGPRSFLITWLIVVPVEAAVSGDRRLIVLGCLLGALSLAGLAMGDAAGLLPASLVPLAGVPDLYALGTASALVYAAGLALTIETHYAEAEQAARAGEARYRLLADHAVDLISRHGADGRIEFASPAALRLTGLPPHRLMGLAPTLLAHPADRAGVHYAFTRASLFGEETRVEWRLIRPDGRALWLETCCRPLVDDRSAPRAPAASSAPAPAGTIAVTRDIHQRKATETELMSARDAAEAASKAKSRFLANMSHELRTPLNAIIGFSEIMRHELFGPLAPRYRDYAVHIHDSGQLLLELINDVLDMAKIEAGKRTLKFERVALAEALRQAHALVRTLAQSRGLTIREEIDPRLGPIMADRRAIQQILLNLLSNAIKFTPKGGAITIGAERAPGCVRLKVGDTGIGIPKEELPRLGLPFEQVEGDYVRSHDGTGLGLALVKSLAQLHHGHMTIASVPGQGTEVAITLPEAPAEALAPEPPRLRGAA